MKNRSAHNTYGEGIKENRRACRVLLLSNINIDYNNKYIVALVGRALGPKFFLKIK